MLGARVIHEHEVMQAKRCMRGINGRQYGPVKKSRSGGGKSPELLDRPKVHIQKYERKEKIAFDDEVIFIRTRIW
jgi:hypothetical protein